MPPKEPIRIGLTKNKTKDDGGNEKVYSYCHLLHPGQKGTILYQLGEYQTTVNSLLADEENAPTEADLDVAMQNNSCWLLCPRICPKQLRMRTHQ